VTDTPVFLLDTNILSDLVRKPLRDTQLRRALDLRIPTAMLTN
jgi:predicted nucleic acid-binding protein